MTLANFRANDTHLKKKTLKAYISDSKTVVTCELKLFQTDTDEG